MISTAKLVTADTIAREVETYNGLLPGPGELAVTMLMEYPCSDLKIIYGSRWGKDASASSPIRAR